MLFFLVRNPKKNKHVFLGAFIWNQPPRDYPGEYTPSAFTNIDSVKCNIVRGNYKELVYISKRVGKDGVF